MTTPQRPANSSGLPSLDVDSTTSDYHPSAPTTPPQLDRRSIVMLYNGVSNRSRGWKSKTPWAGESSGHGSSRQADVKRWDGAAKMSLEWDHLRKDPELWYINGNCFVHLYKKGQSRRGPAFRIPFSALLAAKCRPLLERFTDQNWPQSPHGNDANHIDLYIPAPSKADKAEALKYHLATRNFFAWIFRRSMVGDHLGTSLIALVHTMRQFRNEGQDNVADLVSYADEEGYLDMRNQPIHALAILRLAEEFHLTELYVKAFAHCAGMCERLYKFSEYEHVSSVSRKHIRQARADMDLRLGDAGSMLRSFMEEDLSEANLGLSAGARAHLDRFRSFILAFYTNKMGYYPPTSIDAWSTIFQPEVYRQMRQDFEALYEYLVDESFTTADSSPFMAHGGLCTLQSVHAFDLRHKFQPLPHPLPLLPDTVVTSKESRRRSISWRGSGTGSIRVSSAEKLRPDQRLVGHAALMKATNKSKAELLKNRLVLAYLQFEEDSVFGLSLKADRLEKAWLSVSPMDARKVRWLLIYAVYQTLRSCTNIPPEVAARCDGGAGGSLPYHVAVSTEGLPPWKESSDATTRLGVNSEPSQSVRAALSSDVPKCIDITPDIDYLGLTHRNDSQTNITRLGTLPPSASLRHRQSSNGSAPTTRSRSLGRGMSIRRSLSILLSHPPPTPREVITIEPQIPRVPPPPQVKEAERRKSVYHEIIVHGYGNGTKDVQPSPPTASSSAGTSRSASTSSTGSSVSKRSEPMTPTSPVSSENISVGRPDQDSSLPKSRCCSQVFSADDHHDAGKSVSGIDGRVQQKALERDGSTIRTMSGRRPQSIVGCVYSNDDMFGVASNAPPPAVPKRSSKRLSLQAKRLSLPAGQLSCWHKGLMEELQPPPLRLGRIPSDDSFEWNEESNGPETDKDIDLDLDVDILDDAYWERRQSVVPPEGLWEQFSDLGGLQRL